MRVKTENKKSQNQICYAIEQYYKPKMELETRINKRKLEHLEECHQEKKYIC